MIDEADILSSLQQGVTAAVAQSDNPDLPVKYLLVGTASGGAFVPPADGKYLEIVWIPNNRRGDFRGDEKNHRGLLRLVLHWPKDGGGVYEPVQLLASITRYFTNGLVLSGTQIYGTADPTGLIEQEGEILLPVTIQYQSYRKGA